MELSDTERRIRTAMEEARIKQGLTHAELARRLGIKPPSATVVLTRKSGKIPQSLLDMLDQLGLEIKIEAKSYDRK